MAKLAYNNNNSTLYGITVNAALVGSNFPRLVTINTSSGDVTDLGNVTIPASQIPNLSITILDLFFDYHNNRLMAVCMEQFTEVTNYYTKAGAQVAATFKARQAFRNAIHEVKTLTGVNPINRIWTSKIVIAPDPAVDAPDTLEDSGYYKFVSAACSSQAGKYYVVAQKPFAETDTKKPERWLIAADTTLGDGSDVEIDKISDDVINSINYNPINNRLYGVMFNSWGTAEIEKSNVGFDSPTTPPPFPPQTGGGTGGGTGGSTGGATPLLHITTPTLDNIMVQIGNTIYIVQAANGTGPYSWSVIAGSLPPGFALLPSTSSTLNLEATGPSLVPGTYSFTIQVEDSLGAKAHRPYTIEVVPTTGGTGSVRQPGALIVDVIGTGATDDTVYTRLNGINANVWSGYDFLVVTMLSSKAGQLVEIEYGDVGGQTQLSIAKSAATSLQAKSQQQAVTQAQLSLAAPTGQLSLGTAISRQPSYNRVLVDFQQANVPQDVLIPIDSSRFPSTSFLSHVGFKIIDASQQFTFAVTRIELQKSLGSTSAGFLTQTEAFLKAFGLAAPFSVDDYRALGKFIQYRVTLTTQVPPITPRVSDKIIQEINPATVYNHPLSRLRGGRRRTQHATDETLSNENVWYSQSPIAVPGGYVEDGFGLEPSNEPIGDPLLYSGPGGVQVDIPAPL
jgi:hypothetical protein